MVKTSNEVAEATQVTMNILVQTKKRKAISSLWTVLNKGRKKFEAQLTKSNEIKLACLEPFVSAAFADVEKFWSEYRQQMEKLLDSRKFIKECENLKVNPENVAEHIVFLGSTMINKVLNNGVANILESDLRLYVDSFVSEKTKIFHEETVSISEE